VGLLIGLPALFSTPGDRPSGVAIVPVPGVVTILLVLLQLAAAATAAWVLGPMWLAGGVTVLCVAVTITEQPRWRWLLKASTGVAPRSAREPEMIEGAAPSARPVSPAKWCS
jgi:hypothetical protein